MGDNRINPIIRLDYPDPDVIRVGEVYYMVSTTMHFMPGCEILCSRDLYNWEHVCFVYDRLDSTPEQRLEGNRSIYGRGMWAASLRYHDGMFYVCFVANDTGKTYLYTAENIEGPWTKRMIDGFYHDCSLLFDDDGGVYIVSGNTDIRLQQLKPDLSGPLAGGLDRIIVSDDGNPMLGFEGSHFYKIKGKYYLFLIHSLKDRWRRVEACYQSDSLEGQFTGGDILDDDMGYCGQGVAQGGIVDTPDGGWYAVLFQDRGAVGRIPVLIPVSFKDGAPVFGDGGRIPEQFELLPERTNCGYMPLVASDDFKGNTESFPACGQKREFGCFGLKSVWQFNHEPDLPYTCLDTKNGRWRIENGRLCRDLTHAPNMITQRMMFPGCSGEVTVEYAGLKEGDYAGICALQGCYAMAAVTKDNGKYYLVMAEHEAKDTPPGAGENDCLTQIERERVAIQGERVRLKLSVDFEEMKDEAVFFYEDEGQWKQIGSRKKLYFRLDHFTGCRFGLFSYATRQTGGKAAFGNFIYEYEK